MKSRKQRAFREIQDDLAELESPEERLYYLTKLMGTIVEREERTAQTGAEKELAEMARRQLIAFEQEIGRHLQELQG